MCVCVGGEVITEAEVLDVEEVARRNCLEDQLVAGSDKLKPFIVG